MDKPWLKYFNKEELMIPRFLAHWLHPVMKLILKGQVAHEIHYLNSPPQVPGNAIWCCNHGAKYDTPYCGLAIPRQVWLVAGKQRLTLADRVFFILNGCIWVDRKNKDSKAASAKTMLDLAQKGENIFMFPEGTWNTFPGLPIMPMAWGVIDLSAKSSCPIIPIGIEYRGKDCHIKFGQPMWCRPEDNKLERINALRDAMATLRWDIWEHLPRYSRTDIPNDEWEKEVAKRVADYPPLDFAYEQSCIRREKGVTPPEEAFAHLDNLIPSRENAFLLRSKD